MKLFLMTDLEGVAGVINGADWLSPTGRYYETAKRLLTLEANAAIRAFAEGGFEEIVVADGHGAGAISIELLDPRAKLCRGWGKSPYPFGLDGRFHAAAYVGQHAKAGTPFSHLTHTGWWNVKDKRLNGISIGEYGEGAYCAGELGVPMIFASGEKALCAEVAALTPWVETVPVLEGVVGDTGDDLSGEEYEHFHEAAIHLQPEKSRELIHVGARRAAELFRTHRDRFPLLKLKPPYRLERDLRPYKGQPAATNLYTHPDSIIGVLNASCR
jgi:D-amino peptidase